MKCLNQNCNADKIENDDNFCYRCGHWTAKGFSFIRNKEHINQIINGDAVKKDDNLILMVELVSITFILFTGMCIFRGNDLFKPFYYLKRKVDNYVYGYNTAIIKTDNVYNKQIINNLEEANEFINKDFDQQKWKCTYASDTFNIENDIQESHSIANVSLCDVPSEETLKIQTVIDEMYLLFPNMEGALTNISITNASTNSEYIARFQPMFQFVNPNEDINYYNKINKTQILLNSYYFLNKEIIKNPISSIVGEDWYIKDATWESIISHELGHYISFVILLRENRLENITFVTIENENKINEVLNKFESGDFATSIVKEALNNYNDKYNTNLDINTFALNISKYAGTKNKDNILIADETIAEAIHDYYLHKNDCSKSSYEIINVIRDFSKIKVTF